MQDNRITLLVDEEGKCSKACSHDLKQTRRIASWRRASAGLVREPLLELAHDFRNDNLYSCKQLNTDPEKASLSKCASSGSSSVGMSSGLQAVSQNFGWLAVLAAPGNPLVTNVKASPCY